MWKEDEQILPQKYIKKTNQENEHQNDNDKNSKNDLYPKILDPVRVNGDIV